MNRPDFRVMVLGHPIIAGPVELGGCLSLLACWQVGANGVIPGIVIVAIMAATAKAAERRTAFLAWKREWDALADPADQPKRGISGRTWALAVAIWVGVLLFLVQDRQTQTSILDLAMLVGLAAAAIVGFYWVYYRIRTRHAGRGAVPVTVVAKPIVAALTIQQAYAALPDYCQRILAQPAR